MSNERKDEFLSWRSRLDSPEGVPGQGLDDREQTWERLMDRFREKPRRRLPVYGIVAACILLALIPASLLFHEGIAPSHPPKARPATPLVTRPDGGSRFIPLAVPPAFPARPDDLAQRGGHKEALRSTGRATAGRSKRGVRVELKTMEVTDDTHPSLNAPAAPLVSQIPPATAAPQKKWKVVDLNDLHAGWQFPQRMASNQPFLPIRIGRADPSGGPTVGPSPSGDPGIRIKFNTSN